MITAEATLLKGTMFLIKKLHEKGIAEIETHETPAKEETMAKEVFESNINKIKENKIEFKDPLRVFASVCHIVDMEFNNPREINDSELQDDFNKIQKQEYDYLTSRYHVYTRDGLIQAIMKELGYEDEDVLIALTTGKLEVEETIKEMIGLNNLPSALFN